MRRRVGRPGLVGIMARTAVIAGTANATVGGMNRRGQAQAQQSADAAAFQAQQQAAAQQAAAQQAVAQHVAMAPAPVAPPQVDLMAQLGQLGQMHAQGLLTDAEFTAAKAKLLS